jgi:hypothetical protein
MNLTQRARLARNVFEKIVMETETFEGDDHIGADLAYLMGAILRNMRVELSDDPTQNGPFVARLRTAFGKRHAVWEFVDIAEESW